MDEKNTLGQQSLPATTRLRARPKSSLTAPFLAMLVCLAIYLNWRPTHHTEHRQHGLTYPGEHIEWEPCGEIDEHRVECSAINVPMDQFNADNSGDKTFNIPLVRMRGHNATKNLLINPGGPGGSGMGFLYGRGKYLNTIVGEEFHILSFDPRGVNSSRPAASCYPNDEARARLSVVRDRDFVADSVEQFAWSSNHVQACSATAGEHGKYVNTPQVAADMNSILDAIGQENLIYWGFSYGTTLGQTYAGLYPDRSERLIIDGVSNQFNWYSVGKQTEFLHDTENVLAGFFDQCIKAKSNCTLSSLADSAEDLQDLIFDFSDKLREEPISVYINNTMYGTFGVKELWYNAVFPSLYSPRSWFGLADRLYKMLQGNATEAFLAYGSDPFPRHDDSNTFVMLNDGLSGPKYWPEGRKALLEEALPFLNKSIWAPALAMSYFKRQQWAVPRTHSYIPPEKVETLHPLLIMSMTYDPVCPLVSAQSARDTFKGSRLVEVKGHGHCTDAMPSMCAARHIREFLHDGSLPPADTQCEVEGPYFIRPEDEKAMASQLGLESEELRIHEAQVALAHETRWPVAHFF